MGIFGKLAFWKHKDIPGPEKGDLGAGDDLGLGKDTAGLGNENLGLGDQSGLGDVGKMPGEGGFGGEFTNPPQPMPPGATETPASQPSAFGRTGMSMQPGNDIQTLSKNIEVISSKMDALKAVLDNLSQKVANIEKIAEGEEEEPKKRW